MITATLLALTACSEMDYSRDGTIVGNPGDGMVALARGSGLEYAEAGARLGELLLEGCDGDEVFAGRGGELDLLRGARLELPPGEWCAAVLSLDEGLHVSGAGPDESWFSLSLEPGEVALDSAGFTVDGGAYVLELARPDWITAESLELSGDTELEVGEDHPLFEELSEAVALGSGLYRDDGDGALDEGERQAGEIALGPERYTDAGEDTGAGGVDTAQASADTVYLETGCGGSRGWLLLALLAPAVRRSRRRELPARPPPLPLQRPLSASRWRARRRRPAGSGAGDRSGPARPR